MNKMKVTLITTIRKKTNGNESSKQVIRLLHNDSLEDAIHITKYILVDNQETFDLCCELGYAIGRSFKGKTLMQQRFIINVSSFKLINNLIQ